MRRTGIVASAKTFVDAHVWGAVIDEFDGLSPFVRLESGLGRLVGIETMLVLHESEGS